MRLRDTNLLDYWPVVDRNALGAAKPVRCAPAAALKAIGQVIHTPELLEWIFLEMDQADVLLRVQLVCKMFRALVQGSPMLQWMLDLKPSAPVSVGNGPIDLNYKYRGLVVDFCEDKLGTLEQSWLIDRVFELPECWERPEASWRRMHLTDQPMVSVKLDIEVDEGPKVVWENEEVYDDGEIYRDEEIEEHFCTYRTIDICNAKGVTAGEIFDAVKKEFWSTPAKVGSQITWGMFGKMAEELTGFEFWPSKDEEVPSIQ